MANGSVRRSAPRLGLPLRLPLRLCLGVVALIASGCADEVSPMGDPLGVIEVSIEDAVQLARNEQFEEAIAAVRPHVEQPNPETRALMLYARTLLGARRHSLAIWPLQRVVHRPDAPRDANLVYARALTYGGDELAAIAFLSEKLEETPDDLMLLDIRSQAYELALQYENAAEDLEIVADEKPGAPHIVERLLNLLIKVEDWDSARERMNELGTLLERTGADEDSLASFCSSAAQFERERGNLEEAEKKLRACLDRSPANSTLVLQFESLLDAEDRVDEATELLKSLSEEYPKRQRLQQAYAARLARLGRLEDADAQLLKVAESELHANSWVALANLRLAMADIEGTVVALDKGIEAAMEKSVDDPSLDWKKMDPDSRFGIGDVYVRAGHFERAEKLIDSLDDEPAMALLLRARMKLEKGDPRGALDDYQEAFITFPSNPAGRYLAGRAAVELGEFDLAIDLYQDALRADPNATDAGLVLGQMLAAEGRFTWSLDALSFLMARAGARPDVAQVMARAAASGGLHRFADGLRNDMAKDPLWAGRAAADAARDVVVLSGPEVARDRLRGLEGIEEAHYYEGYWAWLALSIQTGHEAEARASEAAYHQRHNDQVGAWIVRGRLHFEDQEFDEAITASDRAIELNPLIQTPHYDRGRFLADPKVARLDEALASLDRATELDPADPAPAYEAARALFDAGRYDESVSRLRELLISHPWHAKAALMILDAEVALGRADSELANRMAAQASRYAGAAGGAGPRAHYELAQRKLAAGDPEQAILLFERSAKGSEQKANALFGAARSLAVLGREKEAVDALKIAIEMPDLDQPLKAAVLLEELRATVGDANSKMDADPVKETDKEEVAG